MIKTLSLTAFSYQQTFAEAGGIRSLLNSGDRMAEPDHSTRRNHLLAYSFSPSDLTHDLAGNASRLGTHLAGGRDDLWVHQWTFWWVREALRQGLNPFIHPVSLRARWRILNLPQYRLV